MQKRRHQPLQREYIMYPDLNLHGQLRKLPDVLVDVRYRES